MSVKRYIFAPFPWQRELLSLYERGEAWSGKHSNFTPWIAQTYAELIKRGFDFEITDSLSVDGIILADRDTLGNSYPFLLNSFLICTKSDREFHPSATFHVTHNRRDEDNIEEKKIWGSHYIDHWPMPNIIPRDSQRGSKLENIAYIGSRSQLADEMKDSSWKQRLAQIGVNWIPIFDSRLWNDYTNIDLIIAARRFPSPPYHYKGSIKLINSWYAGVPSLLAPESSFINDKVSEYDFIQVNSIEDAYKSIKFLQSNRIFYLQMIERCNERRQLLTRESISNQWVDFFREVEIFHDSWRQRSRVQLMAEFSRKIYLLRMQRTRTKFRSALGKYLPSKRLY